MSLDVGTKLGPYEIVSPLGAANGSELYKATHAEESRTVALRVFPPDWAGGAEFPQIKEHFDKQAQAVAALSHPNIGLLYDIGQQDGVDFVVTEFVEGDTLAARLQRGALPLNEAMQVALAIGDALDKAHRGGVLHRDLNPTSVVLAKTGVKLLDFGLAELRPSAADAAVPKAVAATVAARGVKPGGDLGLEYTAPEQFEGKPADARADIFAFGAIVYEMVTGKKAFEGKSRAVLIAAITTADPDPLTRLQPRAPRALEHVVERCLEKEPDDRWQTAHDLMVQLRWINDGGAPAGGWAAGGMGTQSKMTRVLLAAGVLVAAALAIPATMYFRGAAAPEPFQFRVPVMGLNAAAFALSPDGQTIALVSRPESNEPSSLYVRRTGALAFNRLGGTEDAAQPFWSPDSRYIAFVSGGRLKKVSATGGAPKDIGEAAGFSGGAWSAEGTILFGSAKGLQRVSAEGGKPAAITKLAGKESGHFWPGFLPDGRHFLYLAWSGEASARAVYIGSLDSKDKTKLMTAESNVVYAAPGYVVFHREASLFAQPFDAKNRTLSGEPVHVADEVFSNPASGRGAFDVSQNGALIYFQGSGGPAGRAGTGINVTFAWFDRTGNVVADAVEPGPLGDMDLSPDGKRIAVTRQETGAAGSDIWVIEWQRAGVSTRLTLDPADDLNPVWSPDGIRVAFTTYRKGNADIYFKNANGSGFETPLLETPGDEVVEDWSKDGQYIAYLSGQGAAPDIYVLPLTGDKKPFPVVQGNFRKNEPQFSYDGKWLAYTSDESGSYQVYVTSFPKADEKIQVSRDGGGQPRWRKDGKELFYRAPDGRVMAADIKTVGTLESGVPRLLFLTANRLITAVDPTRHMSDVTPDGQRLVLRGFTFRVPGTLGGGSSATPFAPFFYFPPGQAGSALGATRGLVTPSNGLTVIRDWMAGVEKGEK
ncbi:MAG: PD40 domain-containing protein [Acidobacteriia bacterium]|nr:PD40 domain-containing protein [Terriglobia bacterium]